MVKPETVTKTIGIKLNTTLEQEHELAQLFEAFRVGINWSIKEIEKRYQVFFKRFQYIPKELQKEGKCMSCNKTLILTYNDDVGNLYCGTCARRIYSEYTVRKEIYGTGERIVEHDLKDVTSIPLKTHYDTLFSQAYDMWKSYNAWRNKRIKELEQIKSELHEIRLNKDESKYLASADLIETKAKDLKSTNKKLNWKQAKAAVSKEIYQGYTDKEREKVRRIHDKLLEKRRLERPVHFPELDECKTVKMKDGFVEWKNGMLYMTLFHKGQKEIKFFGKEYLDQFIPKMEQDKVYCNLTKKGVRYYLMYPLEIKVRQSPSINECDTFVYVSSPTKAAIVGYDSDGAFSSVKWFPAGRLANAKRNFKEKRTEITDRKSPEEKMRKIRRRRDKIKRRGSIEARFTATSNHQLTRAMVDYLMEQSENPKILMWNIGNGIIQNFGSKLNYLKSLWAAVQQQEQLKHKSMQMSIPVVEFTYNTCNNLKCSSCGAVQHNGEKPAKTITQLIKGIKNFKCQKCGYELNMMLNQSNNIKDSKQPTKV